MLTEDHKRFIDYYLQTYSMEEAARKIGIPKNEALTAAIDLLANEEIQEAMKERVKDLLSVAEAVKLNKERILLTMMFQYEKANTYNKPKEAVDILAKIAEVSGIDFKNMNVEPINFIINNLDENKL